MGADISAIVGTMPERAGDVEVGKIMKRNVVFGGISWASRFICICGHNLHVLKPRLVGSGYTLVGTFDLLGTRVKTTRDEFAQDAQEEDGGVSATEGMAAPSRHPGRRPVPSGHYRGGRGGFGTQ